MKKVFSIFAIAGISAMLVACGGNSSQTSEATTDSAAVAVDTAAVAVDSAVVESTEVEATEAVK